MNLEINQRNYPLKFNKPVVVICLDGSQKEYLDRASESKLTPNLDKIINDKYCFNIGNITPKILYK